MDFWCYYGRIKFQLRLIEERTEKLKIFCINHFAGFSKDRYLEVCEATGTEPVEEDIPSELGELTYDAQLAMIIFDACPENWEGMSGSFLGKRIECLPALFQIYNVEKDEERQIFDYFKVIEMEYLSFFVFFYIIYLE